ncbi:MAG: hypothetical protein IPK85_03900 [Gemmatimonadetes bacterium]|nr:hypothetical protein [Gemmatimonadota bacterium]
MIINPDNDYIPTAIEKIAESFTASHGVTPRTVETSAVDFHGDGAGSDIAVIWADSLLRDAFETPALEPLGKESFRGRPRGTVSLTGRSDFASVFDGLLFPSDCLMCGGSVGDSLFDGSASGESAVRVGIAPEFNPGLYEPAVNDGSLQSHGFGNDVLGLTEFVSRNDGFAVNFEPSGPGDARGGNLPPDGLVAASQLRRAYAERLGEIETNRIVGVERRAFAGHVYNLQTTTGWYIANNIISHNCRCVMVPEVAGVEQSIPSAETLFGRMSAEQQREVLGAGRYEAWQAGAPLSGFGRVVDDPRWGPVAEVVPLAEVT